MIDSLSSSVALPRRGRRTSCRDSTALTIRPQSMAGSMRPTASRCQKCPTTILRTQGRTRIAQRCRAVADDVPDEMPALSWDPQGLLTDDDKKAVGLLDRHLSKRKVQQAQNASQVPIKRVPADMLAQGGVAIAELADVCTRAELQRQLQADYMQVDLDMPGLKVINVDPPVFVIDGLLDGELCSAIIDAADNSGLMQQSTIGSKKLGTSGNNLSARRTSSSLLIDSAVQKSNAHLKELSSRVQSKIRQLLPEGRWGVAGKMPAGGQYCFEALQTARYTQGQHFLAHEDGFPLPMAEENGFQRSATVVMYLNDVASDGKTRFECLDIAVSPKRGRALLFFPSFKSGEPDPRTLHTAEDAADTKWIAQQWVARGQSASTSNSVNGLLSSSTWLRQPSPRGKVPHKAGGLKPNLGGANFKVGATRKEIQPAIEQQVKNRRLKGKTSKSAPKKGFGS